MAGSGQIKVHFNDSFFDQMLNSAGVRALTRGAAEKALGLVESKTGNLRKALKAAKT